MKDVMKIVSQMFEINDKCCYSNTWNETEKHRRGFLGMLLGTLVASLLGNMLAGTGFIITSDVVSGAGNKTFWI